MYAREGKRVRCVSQSATGVAGYSGGLVSLHVKVPVGGRLHSASPSSNTARMSLFGFSSAVSSEDTVLERRAKVHGRCR